MQHTSASGLMSGKKGLIMGVSNDKSLAWAISQKLYNEGAQLAFSYAEIMEKRIKKLVDEAMPNAHPMLMPCDVAKDEDVAQLFTWIKEQWGNIDFLVHAIAYADKKDLQGPYHNVSRTNFLNALDISCFSFTSACHHAAPLMKANGSIISLTYLGAERIMPNYNVMGVAKAALECSVRYLAEDFGRQDVRVNAVSAGPIKTLAASGISDFNYILRWNQYNAPLRRNITHNDVANTSLYLLSDLGSGVTGEVIHVDAGYHIVGMKAIDAPDISVVTNP